MSLFWKMFYLFYKPETKSQLVVKYCRTTGHQYVNLELQRYEEVQEILNSARDKSSYLDLRA